jgi:diadenosine tetraphosphatase ApaH/serine/threonine PP2A family protein phosphatase
MLGDLINGVDPHGCVQLLQQWSAMSGIQLACLKGNGEEYLLTPDREALSSRPEPWNSDMIRLVQWWEDHLTASDLDWIRSFHDFLRWKDSCLVHDSPIDRLSPESWHNPAIDPKYQEWFHHAPGLRPSMPIEDWEQLWAFMDAQDYSQVFCGHTHVPFYREHERKRVCNLGSAGAPLDGDPRPSWVLAIETPTGASEITIRRENYDINLIHRLIDQTPEYPSFEEPGYKEAYKKWFLTGIHWKAHLSR